MGQQPLIYLKSGTTLVIYCIHTVQPQFLSYLHSARGPIPPHFVMQWVPTPSLTSRMDRSLNICTQIVQPQFLAYLHSGPIPLHLRTQWPPAPSLTYTVGITLTIHCTHTAQPQFLPYLHRRPRSPHFMTQLALSPHLLTQHHPCYLIYRNSYTLIHLQSWHHHRNLPYTNCPSSVHPLLTHATSFYDTVGP